MKCDCPLEEIIMEAKKTCFDDAESDRKWFLSQVTSLSEAIKFAAQSRFPNRVGKLVTHSHQWRNGAIVLSELKDFLLPQMSEINQCKTFRQLHDIVDTARININSIGPLAVYDVSERIGWFLKLYPEEVYMHAGVRDGALFLRESRYSKTIHLEKFPKCFQDMSPAQIESFLCSYKKKIPISINCTA